MTGSDTAESEAAARRAVGGILLLLGTAGLLLGLGASTGWDIRLPLGRFVWSLISLIVAVGGAALIWRTDHPRTAWRPRRGGRRFHSAVLYTRSTCPLCDEAARLLSEYSRFLPDIAEVDIDADPRLQEKFNTCVPVVEFDGRVRFRGHISEPLLRRLIEGTAPVDSRRR